MKRIVLVFVLVICGGVMAAAQEGEMMFRHNGGFYWSDSGVELEPEEYGRVLPEDLYLTFKSAHKQFLVGNTCEIVGYVLYGASAVNAFFSVRDFFQKTDSSMSLIDRYYSEEFRNGRTQFNNAMTTFTIGDALVCFGLIYRSIGKGRLDWVVDTYNGTAGKSVTSIEFEPGVVGTAGNDVALGATFRIRF